jgi:hypothetical protein
MEIELVKPRSFAKNAKLMKKYQNSLQLEIGAETTGTGTFEFNYEEDA